MIDSEVPGVVTTSDTTNGDVIVRLSDEALSIPTEEVVLYLKSDGLADRTRCLLIEIFKVPTELGTCLRINFAEAMEWWCELDVWDALKNFFSSRGSVPCTV